MKTIDDKINEIKKSLSTLDSLFDTGYGRAFKFREKRNSRTVISPAIVNELNEHLIVKPSDRKKGVFFFYVQSKANAVDYGPEKQNQYSYGLDLVIWLNSKAILGKWKGLESALVSIKTVLKDHPFNIDKIYYDADDIYNEFTLDEAEKQYFCHPYYGVKISGTISIFENEC